MGEFYLGQIILFAGNFAPVGWLPCDGRLLDISGNEALFSILGTTYGGDGVTTFALPELRGAAPMSWGQAPGRSNYVIGQTGGSEAVTLTSAQMPGHNHGLTASAAINASNATADQPSPKGGVFAQTASAAMYATDPDGSSTLNSRAITTTLTLAAAGGSQPIPMMSPYLAVTYCICTNGLFPPQG